MKLPRGMFVIRGRIPGVRSNEDALVEEREVGRVLRHRKRMRARNAPSPIDAEYRAHGVPVFDRSAGFSELGSYLNPRK